MTDLQILEIEDRHVGVAGSPLIFRPAECDVQHAFLRLGQFHEARKQKRPHLLHGRPHRMPVHAEDVPEDGRKRRIAVARQTDLFRPLDELRRRLALGSDPRKVTLDIGREDGNAGSRKPLGQHLQRHRFPGARGTRDETVAIGQSELDALGLQIVARFADADEDQPILHIIARIGDRLTSPLCPVRSSHFASRYLRTRLGARAQPKLLPGDAMRRRSKQTGSQRDTRASPALQPSAAIGPNGRDYFALAPGP